MIILKVLWELVLQNILKKKIVNELKRIVNNNSKFKYINLII